MQAFRGEGCFCSNQSDSDLLANSLISPWLVFSVDLSPLGSVVFRVGSLDFWGAFWTLWNLPCSSGKSMLSDSGKCNVLGKKLLGSWTRYHRLREVSFRLKGCPPRDECHCLLICDITSENPRKSLVKCGEKCHREECRCLSPACSSQETELGGLLQAWCCPGLEGEAFPQKRVFKNNLIMKAYRAKQPLELMLTQIKPIGIKQVGCQRCDIVFIFWYFP